MSHRVALASPAAFRSSVRRLAAALRRIAGVPDYERYLAHMRRRHPGDVALSPDEFARDALARRYDRPGSRCC
jgi:uncharacterized short protein YbdD (DUF466 family)